MAGRGRPKVPETERKKCVSLSIDPPVLDRMDMMAIRHGVNRSQIILDAFRTFEGSMHKTVEELRASLREMVVLQKNQEFLIQELRDENQKLGQAQGRAESILNPLKEMDGLSKADKERNRLLKILLVGEKQGQEWSHQVRALAKGSIKQPSAPILMEAKQAFGSWENLHVALQMAVGQ